MKAFIPAFIWALIILGLSTMPAVQLPETFFSPDKVAHAAIYGILVILILRALVKKDNYIKKSIFLAIFVSGSYGFLMEIIQYAFFPGRYFEMGDNLANITGCFLGFLFFEKWMK